MSIFLDEFFGSDLCSGVCILWYECMSDSMNTMLNFLRITDKLMVAHTPAVVEREK